MDAESIATDVAKAVASKMLVAAIDAALEHLTRDEAQRLLTTTDIERANRLADLREAIKFGKDGKP